MVDNLSPKKRSWNMSHIKGKDTKPEKKVRSLLHAMGYRFRIHKKELPGNPDIVLPKYKAVLFVNGCFWHRHKGCKFAYKPKTRVEFWEKKFDDTVSRDLNNIKKLKAMGWNIEVFWECELKDIDSVKNRLEKILPK
ncbi:MAG: DNA mismatch endonuclease Vsr [Desulfobacula sp.]|jgi:DNA mismatch endonuclease, patch repair protein|uniref:very short patch repair endonuclease n=1 Tax=Desulfobacula sp. TaxID=2593537 RepID=UPI001E0BEFCA|nr:DNA mismatch endonuclease Vsr [Desulfobacula sp.]MBT3806117.1 DNA mismatch endonuclease Vsr [Desulfobacula sp.]MBT4026511.1 DNA mismatch endonuclease Vsr [Desulfobacula sp.]MBT4200385.1 DNA mismatch endonuclease Vsr [Desulfobacula sp.]MBT4508427.1 DNA mismatch endonuclease Vsr [Desulfobacula sp.]